MYQFAQCIDSVISSSGIFGVQRRDFIYVILYRILDLVALVSEPLETLCQPILSCSVPDLVWKVIHPARASEHPQKASVSLSLCRSGSRVAELPSRFKRLFLLSVQNFYTCL